MPMPAKPQPRLLLTRPAADSRRFAAMLPEWEAVISPILRIEPVAHDTARLHAARGLVFTSAHAVPAAGAGRGRLALCVGRRTAEAAREAGFGIREGNGFAEGLLPLIEAAEVPLLHPHGRHLARELPVEGMVVYDQIAQPLNDAARTLLAEPGPVIVPLFSPRSARLLSAAFRHFRAKAWIAAISPAAMDQWRAPAACSAIAANPSARAMAATIRRLADREQS